MSETEPVDEVFSDTNILLDFVQANDAQQASIQLIETDAVDTIVSDAVMTELANVIDRRNDIYEDLVEFLQNEDGGITEYDPSERHVYFGANDRDHILSLQMDLRDYDDNRRVLKRLRRIVRQIERRRQHLEETLEDKIVMPTAPLPLEWDIGDIIGNSADATIVADAAGWSAKGGSGILITRDTGDIIDFESELADFLREAQGEEWVLQIRRPDTFMSDLSIKAD